MWLAKAGLRGWRSNIGGIRRPWGRMCLTTTVVAEHIDNARVGKRAPCPSQPVVLREDIAGQNHDVSVNIRWREIKELDVQIRHDAYLQTQPPRSLAAPRSGASTAVHTTTNSA